MIQLQLSPAQLQSLLTLVRDHRSSGKPGSHMRNWSELEDTLDASARTWAEGQKRKIKRSVLR